MSNNENVSSYLDTVDCSDEFKAYMNERKKQWFLFECLKEAVLYCEEQYKISCIDRLPPASVIGLTDDDKYKLLEEYVQTLRPQ